MSKSNNSNMCGTQSWSYQANYTRDKLGLIAAHTYIILVSCRALWGEPEQSELIELKTIA